MERLVYDVEVLRGPDEVKRGFSNPEDMGFGTAVVYSIDADFYELYGPNDLQKIKRKLQDNYVIGFNHVQFDNRVLWGNNYRPSPLVESFEECDLLLRAIYSKFKVSTLDAAIKKSGKFTVFDGSLSLDSICRSTLRRTKSGDGAHAPKMIQKKMWPEVFTYNLHDVRLTTKLYLFVKEHGFLIDRDGNRLFIKIT